MNENERVKSPEKINEYVRIAGPGTYALITALVIVTIAIFLWGFTGSLPLTESVSGLVDNDGSNYVLCYVDATRYTRDKLVDKEALVLMPDGTSVSGKVFSVGDLPVSKEEISKELESDWLTSNLVVNNYSRPVWIIVDDSIAQYFGQLTEVKIITDEVRPISFLTR